MHPNAPSGTRLPWLSRTKVTVKKAESLPEDPGRTLRRVVRVAGPGIITGGADNDPAGITTYSSVGASSGFSQLWLLVLSIPLLIAVQGVAARLGAVTKLGLAELIRNEFGMTVALAAGSLLVVANIATIGADLVGMAAVLQLLTGVKLILFIVPLVVVMGYVTIFQNFKTIQRLFLWLIAVFLTYVAAGILAHPHWGSVLLQIVVPPIRLNLTYVSGAVALLGTTITPYLFFWQTAGEREERRGVEQMGDTYLDVTAGMLMSNLVAGFIMISTGATLFAHHQSVNTAAQAAHALRPVAGPAASVLFSIGILGSGFVAIPILAVSTGYALSGTFGWRMGLGRQAFAAPGFYSVIALSLLAGVQLAISGFSPIKALLYSQILNGIVAPPLLVVIILLATRSRLMGAYVATVWERAGVIAAAAIMGLADLALLYNAVR